MSHAKRTNNQQKNNQQGTCTWTAAEDNQRLTKKEQQLPNRNQSMNSPHAGQRKELN
jgi:hypothetical protein